MLALRQFTCKNHLSINNVDLHPHLAKDDDGCGQIMECQNQW